LYIEAAILHLTIPETEKKLENYTGVLPEGTRRGPSLPRASALKKG
jgi:hypothetical protein